MWTLSVVTRKQRTARSANYRSHLLRRSFRDEHGRPRNETLANLSALPDHVLGALAAGAEGRDAGGGGEAFEVERSVPHGDVAAAHVMASALGLRVAAGPAVPGAGHRATR